MVGFALQSPWLWLLLLTLAFTVAYFLVSLSVNVFTPDFNLAEHEVLVANWKADMQRRKAGGMLTRQRIAAPPTIAIWLPICGESLRVLRNTWGQVMLLVNAYRELGGICNVYVLDDAASPDARELAATFPSFTYFVRPNRGENKKSGNLLAAFRKFTSEEFVLILDADFCPGIYMLEQMIPVMLANPEVGIVQSPQFFRTLPEYGWLQRSAGAIQELFYRLVQVSRNFWGGSICVGSCGLYRMSALRAIGGPYQKEHSEDVWTGFTMLRYGWKVYYLPLVLATGLCPSDLISFLRQQYRWCTGSMSLCFSRVFWETKIPLRTRMCFVSGFFYYMHTALFVVLAPVVPVILVSLLPGQVQLVNYGLIIPSLFYNYVVFPTWHKCDYRVNETAAAKMVYSWAHAFALFDLIRKRPLGWRPTGSAGADQGQKKTHWHVRNPRKIIGGYGLGVSILTEGFAILRMITTPWPTLHGGLGQILWQLLTTSSPLSFAPIAILTLLYARVVLRAITEARA
jgi:cellulose synthase (UDP-forming)